MRPLALITGATGFVGSHLAEHLAAEGWRIRAMVRPTSDIGLLQKLGVETVVGELRSPGDVARASGGADVVYHLAAATFERDEASFVRANVEGTRSVVEGSVEGGARRLVYLSSYAACGPSEPGRPRTLDAVPGPLTAYGRTKLEGETLVREGTAGRMEAVILRAPTVYGPRDSALLSYFQLVRWWLAPAPAGGDRQLHLIFAPDLARALGRAATASPGTFAVADPRVYAWSELVDEIATALDRRPFRPRLPVGLVRGAARLAEGLGRLSGRTVTFNREKAEEMLAPGWVCDLSSTETLLPDDQVTPLATGIADTVRWYTRQGWL